MKSQVQLPSWLAAIVVGSIISLQTWEVRTISALSARLDVLTAKVEMLSNTSQPHQLTQR